jgi:DNA-binding transcriptional regulator YhcF (GntR family)
MLVFVPVTFDLYRPLKPRLRWAMQCLVSFADHAGRCFPSVRTFALHAGISKSAAQRDLADLVTAELVTRKRRPGGVYIYRIDPRFLPRMAPRKLSQPRDRKSQAVADQQSGGPTRGVPGGGTEEKPPKNNQDYGRGRPRFATSGVREPRGVDGLPRQIEWEPRLRGWAKSRFWLPTWGPNPTEPGCFVPPTLLQPGG